METPIWGAASLVSEGVGTIITQRPILVSFLNVVADLIDSETGAWDLDRLNQFLWPCDIPSVLQVPLGTNNTPDSSYWFYSKHGRFTVRSCYHLIMERAGALSSVESGGSRSLSAPEWKWLWGLQLPPKIRVFLWRACNEILPSKATLVHRKVGGDPYCSWCKGKIETTSHPFFECSRSALVWCAQPFTLFLPARNINFLGWLRILKSNLDP